MLVVGRSAPTDQLLPEVIEARCVHSRMEQASCRACVDACPTGAWVIDDERLGIDTERCDGCGLCAPVCPEGAIAARCAPAEYRVDGVGIAFAACGRAGPGLGDRDSGAGLVPCVHLFGVRALLDLQRRGVRRLTLSAGDCDTCPRGTVTRFERHLDQVNALLLDRGQEPIEAYPVSPQGWARSRHAAEARHRPPSMNRRAFFRGMMTAATETAVELAERADPGVPDFTPPGRLIPRTEGSQLSLNAPRIDGERCSGCDACARLCPHAAIRVEPSAYRFDPDGCTGCGICVDVCETGAASVRSLDPSPQDLLPLLQRRCAACGAPFHTPAPETARGLCPICGTSNHRTRLFQVLG